MEALRTANFVLTQRLEDAREQLTARQSETSQWANSMEADAERHFNVSAASPTLHPIHALTHSRHVCTPPQAGAHQESSRSSSGSVRGSQAGLLCRGRPHPTRRLHQVPTAVMPTPLPLLTNTVYRSLTPQATPQV